jgi:hypothetical protein
MSRQLLQGVQAEQLQVHMFFRILRLGLGN